MDKLARTKKKKIKLPNQLGFLKGAASFLRLLIMTFTMLAHCHLWIIGYNFTFRVKLMQTFLKHFNESEDPESNHNMNYIVFF